jgi:hypothetical protein
MNATDSFNASWNIGHLHKHAFWTIYAVFNFVGLFLCTLLFISIVRSKTRNNTQIFVAGHLTGCMYLGLSCGAQCILNAVYGYFYGGATACWIEAFFHVSSIMVQFWTLVLIALNSYLHIVHNVSLRPFSALCLIGIVWFTCPLVTYALGRISPPYLLSAGLYCFYDFRSAAIAAWLVPGLGLAIVTQVVCYSRIVCYAKHTAQQVLTAMHR